MRKIKGNSELAQYACPDIARVLIGNRLCIEEIGEHIGHLGLADAQALHAAIVAGGIAPPMPEPAYP